MQLLKTIKIQAGTSIKDLQAYYDCLLFMIAHPDNRTVHKQAAQSLELLDQFIAANEKIQEKLYNTGLTNTSVCAAFSFEIVKWMRQTFPLQIILSSFEATSDQIKFILSAVMPKVESEILQDANAEWKDWLQQFTQNGTDLLDNLVAIFDTAPMRPEIKDELWNAMGVNVEINVGPRACLPPGLVKLYTHRSLQRKPSTGTPGLKPIPETLTMAEAGAIIETSRIILVRHLREMNPITFTAPRLVNYYQLSRGISIALVEMVKERRHPLESYMGYTVFKNGLPVAYAGSWVIFDSARIGLNVFPAYRGGESQYIFQQVLQLHKEVYRLKRFSVDPYQIGKHNSDGINSGAFWVYYQAGFRPLMKEQRELAAAEERKINTTPGYRTPARTLKTLAQSRLGLVFDKTAVNFDATDLSRAWAGILAKKYNNNRVSASTNAAGQLAEILDIHNDADLNLQFVLNNWAGLLLWDAPNLRKEKQLLKIIRRLCILKARGDEKLYIRTLQAALPVRKYLEKLLQDFVG